MNKKLFLAVTMLGTLACNTLFPPEPTLVPSVEAQPQIDSNQPPFEELVSLEGFTIVRLHTSGGDLQTMLSEEAKKASALGQTPVVEFDATWCPPCVAIDSAIEARNELMLKAYAGTYIIKLNVDEWGWDNGRIQSFAFDGIPVYFKLDSLGNQTGEVIDGGAWDEDIPENIAPVMDEFFHG
jgi:thiol-disulfide isomerase/thioredoxin